MVVNTFDKIAVKGLAVAVPSKWVSIESLKTEENSENLERFVKNTGITGHYFAHERQTASDFCYVAAESIVNKSGIDRKDIGVLVFITQYPDYKTPSTACTLHFRLGLSNSCIAFDVNLGCSGFTYGMNIVSSLLKLSSSKYGLLLVGDTAASTGRQTGNNKLLFGDAGSAVLLAKTSTDDRITICSMTDGSGFKNLWQPNGFARHRDRPNNKSIHNELNVFNFAINEVPRMINGYFELTGLNSLSYDALVLHQANLMIIKNIAKRTKFNKDQLLISLDVFSNTSGASIPTALVKYYGDSDDDKRLRLMTCGFGVGLSWALADITIDTQNIYPLIKTDEYFDDGLFV